MDDGFLALESVEKRYGAFTAVRNLNLSLDKGNCLVLLGPSGCGKTTTLNIIAGFVAPDAGRVKVGNQDITRLPPHQRGMGMVFQDYALFPHLSVADNVAFGLKMRQSGKDERRRKAMEALQQVGLEGMADRFPSQLSGGQRQRVALARALVIRPALLLFDEPLSNLDARLREAMRVEIRKVLDETRITAVFVTHDQAEAFAIADRIALMDRGQILQFGLPHELYERPASHFAATFLGNCNLLAGRITGSRGAEVEVDVEGMIVNVMPPAGLVERDVTAVVRPHHLRLDDQSPLRGVVETIEYLGSQTRITIQMPTRRRIVAEVSGRLTNLARGQNVGCTWDPSVTWLLSGHPA